MDFDNGFRYLCDDAVPPQHSHGSVDNVIFQYLLFDRFTPAFRFATAFGKAGIIIMDISRLARAALAYHFMLAVAAYEFSRKYVVEDLFFTAGCIFVFFIDRVHLIP